MTKPYLLIAGHNHYPSGDTEDWKGCFETYKQAEQCLQSYVKGSDYDWYEIVDLREWTER
jgi:hypothetical protein